MAPPPPWPRPDRIGAPMLVVSRRNFDVTGTTVEFGRTWFRGARLTLVTRLGSPRR